MKRYKKVLSAALIVSCVVVLLTTFSRWGLQDHFWGNGGKAETERIEKGWKYYADEPIELQWYVNFSWLKIGWGENLVSQKITEETGVSINFLTPIGDESEKINSMIASDTLPDFVTLGWWESQANEMIKNGNVYALNELADLYDPYFYEVTDSDVVKWYTKEDGNIYCYPNSSYKPEDYQTYDIGSNQNFLVRKDIYEAIGSPDMTTPEGFVFAVKTAAEMFPEVDGYSLIPVGADEFRKTGCNSFDKYLQNFLAIPWEKDGRAYDRFTDPEYLCWLKVFRKLNEEGLLADDIFIDKRVQIEEKITQGRYFCMLFQGQDMLEQQKILYKKDPNSVYIAVDGPKNSKGQAPILPGPSLNGWTVTFISKNCENPERAIAFLSYLLSERGQKMTYLGVEGITYDLLDGQPVIRPEVSEVLHTDREKYDRLYGADNTYWMMQNNVMQMKWRQRESEVERQITEWTFPYTVYAGQYEVVLESGTEAANIFSKIEKEWGDTLPRMLLASTEKEFEWYLETFLEKRSMYGYDIVEAAVTEEMHRMKEKLSME